MKLAAVMLGTENPEVLGMFYTKVLGEPDWQQDDWYGYNVSGESLMVGPHSEVKGANQSPGRIMFIFEAENLHDEFDRIKELGAEIVAKPYQPGGGEGSDNWMATFADPDNNYFQLSTPWRE